VRELAHEGRPRGPPGDGKLKRGSFLFVGGGGGGGGDIIVCLCRVYCSIISRRSV